jgi:hypothetical protein
MAALIEGWRLSAAFTKLLLINHDNAGDIKESENINPLPSRNFWETSVKM